MRENKFGGPDRDRTGDLMNAIHARSQLRYWPTLRGPLDDSAPSLKRQFPESSPPILTLHPQIVTGLLAAPFGFIDWLSIPSATRAKRIGAVHGGGNVLVVLLFALSWTLRGDARKPFSIRVPPPLRQVRCWPALQPRLRQLAGRRHCQRGGTSDGRTRPAAADSWDFSLATLARRARAFGARERLAVRLGFRSATHCLLSINSTG